jgi:putative FmdB family regulatory protein
MPTYEYRCKDCGEHLEVVQAFTDDPLTECPACAGPLRKVFGNIGITFKGSGFYKTDSRSKKSAAAASESKADGSSSEKSDAKSDSKSDSKSDAKSDSKSDKKSEPKKESSATSSSDAKSA